MTAFLLCTILFLLFFRTIFSCIVRIISWAIRTVRRGADTALTRYGRRDPDGETNIRNGIREFGEWFDIIRAALIIIVVAILIFSCF